MQYKCFPADVRFLPSKYRMIMINWNFKHISSWMALLFGRENAAMIELIGNTWKH